MWNPSFSHWVLHAAVFAVLCWALESGIVSLRVKKWTSRSLLMGPWQPLRGVFALWLIALPVNAATVWLVPVLAAVTGLAVDGVSRFLLRLIFRVEYRVSEASLPKRALLYAMGGALLRLAVHPGTRLLEDVLSSVHLRGIGGLLVVLIGADILLTVYALARLPEAVDAFSAQDPSEKSEIGTRLYPFRWSFRLLVHSPGIAVLGKAPASDAARDAWGTVREAYREREVDRLRKRWAEERRIARTAWRSLTATNIVWMFLIGSVVGFVIETLFCLVRYGVLESRQGMLYGPFSQIYGFGAILLAAVLLPLQAHGTARVFFGSMVLGGLYEAGASFIQEKAFHTVSWEYSGYQIPLLGGRTSLLYMLFWGILGVAFMQWIYPRMIAIIQKVPVRPKRVLTWVIVVLMGADLLLSGVVVHRWAARSEGKPPVTTVDRWIDAHYTDKLLYEIYPNMRFPQVEGS